MDSRAGFVDRRKRDRFNVKKGCFVEIKKPHKSRLFNFNKPDPTISAPIIDISLEGLAFQYVDQDMWSFDSDVLSISKKNEKNKICQIPFKAVSDFAITRLPNAKFKRRCGVKFGHLPLETKLKLYSFINANGLDVRSKKDRRQFLDTQYNGAERRSGIERRSQMG